MCIVQHSKCHDTQQLSTGISQCRRDTIDAQMNAALHPFTGIAETVTADELQLQMMQWVNVRKTVPDRACQSRVGRQALAIASDQVKGLHRTMPFGIDLAEYFLA